MAVKRNNWLNSARQKLGRNSVIERVALLANQPSLSSSKMHPGSKRMSNSQSPSDYLQGRHTCTHVGWIRKKFHLQEHSHESWRSRVNARSFSSLPPLGLADMSCVHPVMMDAVRHRGRKGHKCQMKCSQTQCYTFVWSYSKVCASQWQSWLLKLQSVTKQNMFLIDEATKIENATCNRILLQTFEIYFWKTKTLLLNKHNAIIDQYIMNSSMLISIFKGINLLSRLWATSSLWSQSEDKYPYL